MDRAAWQQRKRAWARFHAWERAQLETATPAERLARVGELVGLYRTWYPEAARGDAIEVVGERVRRMRAASAFRILPGDSLAFVRTTRVLPLETKEGVRVDLIFGQLPYEERAIRRAVVHEPAGLGIRVCTAEDLIVHKIISDRAQDREDIRGIIQRRGAQLDRAYLDPIVEGLARELARPDLLAFYRACLGLPEGSQP